jgi:hypothetical protein
MPRLRCTLPTLATPSPRALPTRLTRDSSLYQRLQAWHKLPTLERLLTLSPREHELYNLYRSQSKPLLCKPLYLEYHTSLYQATSTTHFHEE